MILDDTGGGDGGDFFFSSGFSNGGGGGDLIDGGEEGGGEGDLIEGAEVTGSGGGDLTDGDEDGGGGGDDGLTDGDDEDGLTDGDDEDGGGGVLVDGLETLPPEARISSNKEDIAIGGFEGVSLTGKGRLTTWTEGGVDCTGVSFTGFDRLVT